MAPGQTIYVRCRAVSYLQAHPFTLASVTSDAADKGQVSGIVHIKVLGPWTKALRALAAKGNGLTLQVRF